MNQLHLTLLLCISLGFSIAHAQSPRPTQPSENTPNRNPSSTTNDQQLAIQLKNADITQVIAIYGEVTGRTVLRPQLTLTPFNVDIQAKNKSEAIAALTEAFEDKGLKVIPDGEKFVMIIPKEKASMAIPRSAQIKSTPGIAPAGEINFPKVDFARAAMIYANLRGKTLDQTRPIPPSFQPISLRTHAPLTKEETIYALETLFSWQDVKFVPVGNDLLQPNY